MLRKIIALLSLILFIASASPAMASITIRNKTELRLDLVIKDTRRRQNISINPDERLSIQTEDSGGQLILYKKGEEMEKKYFDDGDKLVIKVENDKIVIKEVDEL